MDQLLFRCRPLQQVTVLENHKIRIKIRLNAFAIGMEIDGLPIFKQKAIAILVSFHGSDDVAEHVEIDVDAGDGDELAFDEDRHDIGNHTDAVITIDIRFEPLGLFRPQRPVIPVRPVHGFFSIGFDRRNRLNRKIVARIAAGIPEAVGRTGYIFIVVEIITLNAVDTADGIIKRPPDLVFQAVPIRFIAQFLRVLDFVFDRVADVMDDIFRLDENGVQRRIDMSCLTIERPGGNDGFIVIDKNDSEGAKDHGQRQRHAADDSQESRADRLHHNRLLSLCLLYIAIRNTLY